MDTLKVLGMEDSCISRAPSPAYRAVTEYILDNWRDPQRIEKITGVIRVLADPNLISATRCTFAIKILAIPLTLAAFTEENFFFQIRPDPEDFFELQLEVSPRRQQVQQVRSLKIFAGLL